MSLRAVAAGPLSTLTRTGILNNGGAQNFGANTSVDVAFTVPGTRVGDLVTAYSLAALTSGLVVGQCLVTAPDTVSVRVANVTVAAINGVAVTLSFAASDPSLLLG